MNYQNEELPKGAIKVGSTPVMTEETVKPAILQSHLAPKGKIGLLVVEKGHCQYVWEDEEGPALDADPQHPIVIFPERYHHVVITGPVKFKVEFYTIIDTVIEVKHHEEKKRPGEDFL
jgi:tellurite resistance-related uncharacterized protein